MIEIRPFATLGAANHGWLEAHYHFSFADYHDPNRMKWGALRVWNDDWVAPRTGFPAHPHRNMEIITFVRSGVVSHRDSLGNEGRTGAGNVQVMSAGTGITHAEFNLEDVAATGFQIWILPDRLGGEPRWGQRDFPSERRQGAFEILASGTPDKDDALLIRADAKVAACALAAGQSARWQPAPGRHQYLVGTGGSIRVNGIEAHPRDGVAIVNETEIIVEAIDSAEVVLVDAR